MTSHGAKDPASLIRVSFGDRIQALLTEPQQQTAVHAYALIQAADRSAG